jgi:hypothetical protein
MLKPSKQPEAARSSKAFGGQDCFRIQQAAIGFEMQHVRGCL